MTKDNSETRREHEIWPPAPERRVQYDDFLTEFLEGQSLRGNVTRYELAQRLRSRFNLKLKHTWDVVNDYCKRERPDLLVKNSSWLLLAGFIVVLTISAIIVTSADHAMIGFIVALSLYLFAAIGFACRKRF